MAETDDGQDTWQRATLTAALTAGSPSRLRAAADQVGGRRSAKSRHRDHEVERWVLARWPERVRVEQVLISVEDLR